MGRSLLHRDHVDHLPHTRGDVRRPAAHGRRASSLAALVGGLLLIAFVGSGPAGAVATQVDLGTAATYSVLGGQSVTNTGPSLLNADLGVSPGTSITGFPPGTIGGSRHAADATALQAQSDLTIAYDNAAGQAKSGDVAGDLVGQTKVAGVYKSTGPLALSGTLTLDAQGDPNSVFIFQIASTLKTATASYVNLINGAQACHVFWQVGSSATLGTASVFKGTILALTSISVTTDATVQGRALARNGSVTLDDDTFTSAACGTSVAATATTTTVTATPKTTTTGTTVTLVADVGGISGTPTGTVVFRSGGVVVGTAPVDHTGRATLTIPAGSHAGTKQITATYGGSTTSLPSTSTVVTVNVRARAATPTPTTPTQVVVTTPPVGTPIASTGPAHLEMLMATAAGLFALGLMLTSVGRHRRRGLHRR